MRTLVLRLFATGLALAAVLPAQQRHPLIGNVLQADNQPLAGATVTLVEDDPDLVGLDPVDVLTATTDRRGRFVASALRGVRYTAFAVGPETDGSALVAQPVWDLASGRPAVLRATVTGRPRRVQLEDLSGWGEAADLRVRLTWKHCPGHFAELAIDEAGGIEVPASSVVATAALYTATGGFLGGMWISPHADDEVTLPQCTRVKVRVVDEHNQPIAGAAVAVQRQDRGGDYFTIVGQAQVRGDAATTDAQGRASLRCELWRDPFETAPDSLVLLATKDGFVEGASGWAFQRAFVNWKVAAHKGREVRITLKAATARNQPDKAAEDRRGRLFAMTNVTLEQQGAFHSFYLPRTYDLLIDAAGRPCAPHVPEAATELILKVPPVNGRRVMLLPTRFPTLPTCEPSTRAPLMLQLLDASGGPASNASVLLVPRHSTTLDFWHVHPLVPDQAGRLEVLLQRGEWSLLAMDATAWISLELDEWSADEPLKLQLAAKPSRRVRVLDAAGHPVAGATFEPGAFASHSAGAPGVPNALANLGWNSFGHHVRQAKTDGNGEATLWFLPWPDTQPTAFAWLGNFRTRSADAPIQAGDDVLVVRLK